MLPLQALAVPDFGPACAGFSLYSYATGTTNPLSTYTDYTGATANPSPVVLDADGRANVWLGTQAYDFQLLDLTGTEVWSSTNYLSSSAQVMNNLANPANGLGAALIGYMSALSTATPRTLSARLNDTVSAYDAGLKGDGSDESAALLAAGIACSGRTILIPANMTISIGSSVSFPVGCNVSLRGESRATSCIKGLPSLVLNTKDMLSWRNASDFSVTNLRIDGTNAQCIVGSEALLGVLSCTDIDFDRCDFVHWLGTGLALNSCNRWGVTRNYIVRDTAVNTYNTAFLAGSSRTTSTDGVFEGNICMNSGTDFSAQRVRIAFNTCANTKFGGGIVTEQDSVNSGYYQIIGNTCYGGSGTDTNNTCPPGMETWGSLSTIIGNVFYNNSGSGMDQGGQLCTVIGNLCFNNGQTGGNGITSRYGVNPKDGLVYGASGSIYIGNKCFDSQPTKTQTYGYQDQSPSLSRITLLGNDFNNNKTAAQLIQGSLCNYQGPALEGFYTLPAAVSLVPGVTTFILTVAGAAPGDYVACAANQDLQGVEPTGYVKGTNAVVALFNNQTGSAKTIPAGTVIGVRVTKGQNSPGF